MCTCIMSNKVSQYSSVATVISCNSCFSYQNNTLLLLEYVANALSKPVPIIGFVECASLD